jgi:hypothetical protein
LDIPEADFEDENDDLEDENSFHGAGTVEHAVRGGIGGLVGVSV